MTKSFNDIFSNAKLNPYINELLTSEKASKGMEIFKKRVNMRLTQKDLALESGVESRVISKVEAGFDEVPLKIISEIENALERVEKRNHATID
ncbi:helix-turn-helix domain-containing protein [Metabacillus idriensis]|uniref:helix-turn-helix domain-containing protein n=1 Tax=Metabacillus idriensis TaxID=324768 RepID=UPI001747E304|nr:helix-turn-helix domain-containing protein [Metabacillus idriensis]